MSNPPPKPTKPASPPTGGKGPLPHEVERALALRDVMQHAVDVQRESAPKKPRSKAAAMAITLLWSVPLLAFSAYSLIAKPEFIWGPRVEAMAPDRAEANARFGMFYIAQRLAEHRRRNGAYPATLAEIDLADPAVTYRLHGDTAFELTSIVGGATLVLRSGDNWDAFLARSAPLIKGAGR